MATASQSKARLTKADPLSSITSFINPFLGAAINIALVLPSVKNSHGSSWNGLGGHGLPPVFSGLPGPLEKLAHIKGRKQIFLHWQHDHRSKLNPLGAFTVRKYAYYIRALQGIGSAMVFGTGIAIIPRYTLRENGRPLASPSHRSNW